ncbi:MAG: phosphoglucosamine mutase, partial [Melioribacteraceae bacterium]|nr:phosphoglucosamine mutase [Melioribacteraceae bacterium]
ENLEMLNKLESAGDSYKKWNELGKLSNYSEGLRIHSEEVLKLVDVDLIKSKKFKVVLDCVNGAGSFIMPDFLKKLGCEVIELNCEKSGVFPRLPEPIPENLTETMECVKQNNADLAIVVDPDVDRLVLITDQGEPFVEENTITLAAKHVLSKAKGSVVVNLSTTRAVDDVAKAEGCKVFRSPVGEANVVKLMKEVDAVIGGEGSGGVIYPELHYGRDALVGTVLTLEHLAEQNKSLSQLKSEMPQYSIAKKKILLDGINPDVVVEKLTQKYSDEKINTDDGLRIDFDDHWAHFRKSNTEPIIRCITEAKTEAEAEKYINKYFNEVKELMK